MICCLYMYLLPCLHYFHQTTTQYCVIYMSLLSLPFASSTSHPFFLSQTSLSSLSSSSFTLSLPRFLPSFLSPSLPPSLTPSRGSKNSHGGRGQRLEGALRAQHEHQVPESDGRDYGADRGHDEEAVPTHQGPGRHPTGHGHPQGNEGEGDLH